MTTIVTLALLLACTDTPSATESYYVPKTHHLTVAQCTRRLERWMRKVAREDHIEFPAGGQFGIHESAKRHCEWYGGSDIPEKCKVGYHADTQQACYGYGAAEIPTLRTICHSDRGAHFDLPCGVSCSRVPSPPPGESR